MYTVLVIDDSISMRKLIKDIINSMEDFEVVDTAVDAYEAREKIKQLEPDLVTIDLNMPKMNGVTFLRNLMRLHPMPAIVISGENVRGSDIFDDGAVGFISKPALGESMEIFKDRICDTLQNLTFLFKRYTLKKPKPIKPVEQQIKKVDLSNGLIERRVHPDEVLRFDPARFAGNKIIAIGSSTGGVESLLTVFKDLPSNLPPIVIAQHIPYGFSSSFAQRLNSHSSVDVSEVTSDVLLQKGHAYLAPGNMHLVVEKKGSDYYGKLLDAPRVSRHKPSVDILFRSVNNSAGGGAMAIMMTGMGDDGTIGMKELFDNGAYTIAQNEESCVVFGMPAQAIKAGAIKEICHLNDIASFIINFSNNKYRK
ncbi:MAG: chemotaxis response regulator protein-glutamate methylesterase [Campylobacterales bacterium]|nr:chemotaxis response regulator protein-glutamate methylesterase [Campylobacterales bacterium]